MDQDIYEHHNLTLKIPFYHGKYEGFSAVNTDDMELSATGHYSSATKAAKGLKAQALDQIRSALAAVYHYERLMIHTNDGTVLLVEFSHGSWGYRIWRAGSSCSTFGEGTFEDHCIRARKHANDSYGGIAWECR